MPYANVGPKNGNGMRVQWQKDSHVQIVATPFLDGMPEEETLHAETTYWATLDRKGLNDLITTLRKARDDAYGKDA